MTGCDMRGRARCEGEGESERTGAGGLWCGASISIRFRTYFPHFCFCPPYSSFFGEKKNQIAPSFLTVGILCLDSCIIKLHLLY